MYSFLVLIGRYLHIQDREQSNWLRERLETPNPWTFTTEQKVRVLDGLTRATHFERFLALKVKRFSCFANFPVGSFETLWS